MAADLEGAQELDTLWGELERIRIKADVERAAENPAIVGTDLYLRRIILDCSHQVIRIDYIANEIRDNSLSHGVRSLIPDTPPKLIPIEQNGTILANLRYLKSSIGAIFARELQLLDNLPVVLDELRIVVPMLRGINRDWAQIVRATEERIQRDYDAFADYIALCAGKMSCILALYIYGRGENNLAAVGLNR